MKMNEATSKDNKGMLLGKLHDSLHDNSRSIGITDTILVGATYVFNILLLLMITVSEKKSIIFVLLACLIIINILILATFKNSRELREKLHARQKQIYEDLGLAVYFDESVIQNYKSRYNIWMALDIVLGITVLVVSILLKF